MILFLRVESQFNGIEITAYPFDIDSSLHLKLGDNISSENSVLNEFYIAGTNCLKAKTKDGL
jgi:hypothetical protein